MTLEIKVYPNQILKNKALTVEKIDQEIFDLIQNMKETMVLEEEGKIKGVGLAANQVGVLKRIIVILTKQGLKGFINPKILRLGKEKEIGKEGCLSLPGLWLEIKRPKTAEIFAIDESGKEIRILTKGFLARVFQHEIDHLDGILFLERLNLLQRWNIRKQLDSLLKNPNDKVQMPK